MSDNVSVVSDDSSREGYKSLDAISFHRPSTTFTKSDTDTDDNNNNNNNGFADKETKRVIRSKLLVLFVLLIATGSVAYATFSFTTREQDKDFKVRFEDFAYQIVVVSRVNIENVFKSYETLSLAITNHAANTDAKFPFVTYPEFVSQATPITEGTAASIVISMHFVKEEERADWEKYTYLNQGWVQRGLNYQSVNATASSIIPFIYHSAPPQPDGTPAVQPAARRPQNPFFAPMFQFAPVSPNPFITNYDVFDLPSFAQTLNALLTNKKSLFSAVVQFNETAALELGEAFFPESNVATPIFDTNRKENVVGMLAGTQTWHSFFSNLIPEGVDGLFVVVRNTCNQTLSYVINGPEVTFLGSGDLHDTFYDHLGVVSTLSDVQSFDSCSYTFNIYPSKEFEDAYKSNHPIYYTVAVIFIFFLTAAVFIIYDCVVERRQDLVMTTATRSNALVNSLFPANVRDRLLDDAAAAKNKKKKDGRHRFLKSDKNNHKNNTGSSQGTARTNLTSSSSLMASSKPIADLFPHATVMFADIVGFTAWSSVREPTQVFMLLETVYKTFDRIAKKLGVFKVETIGDTYVAAAGLPEFREDHAFVMVRFARDCLVKMRQVANRLEATLGPDTSELTMRFGLHSGPVTAGVLRGEKSRFQLFGDTVNTAARMESTGQASRVQLSQETADLLIQEGKSHWIKPRKTKIQAKGKGELQTYWLDFSSTSSRPKKSMPLSNSLIMLDGSAPSNSSATRSVASDNESEVEFWGLDDHNASEEKYDRLVDWNVDVLQGLLKKIVAMRVGIRDNNGNSNSTNNNNNKRSSSKSLKNEQPIIKHSDLKCPRGETVLEEVREIITLPSKSSSYNVDPEIVVLDSAVIEELQDYVKYIAAMYRPNAFHSFDHASHVTQSVTKLLSRVVTPSSIVSSNDMHLKQDGAAILHQYTYGITSDPITQFACAFSAMIHDVDHVGLPNSQLVKEEWDIAKMYKNKSVAEQNSVDLAWELLMEPKYENLRSCIYSNQSELDRFRQLVVNSVMATDICDKELGALRKKRWEKAFANNNYKNKGNDDNNCSNTKGDDNKSTTSTLVDDTSQEAINRKATIVIEHLIQASDVSHTMQHWHVYIKWNERFFRECYKAYKDGRAEKDPSTGWYQGELGFFDFYVIPLAKKLKDCGVFGVSSDEYLNYAAANRQEWEKKGQDIVRGYLERYHQLEENNKMEQ